MSYLQALSNFILDNNASGLDKLFSEDADLTIANIYKNGFFRSCREVLNSTFPMTQSFAGEDVFRPIAQGFIRAHPPNKATLAGYGEQFSEWLRTQPIDQNQLLSEIAKLDWSWIACLHGKDAMPLGAETFQTKVADNQNTDLPSIALLPNAQIQHSNTKAWDTWLDLKKQTQLSGRISEATEAPQFIIMWRPDMEVFARALTDEEFYFIDQINRHQDINKASELILEKYPNFDLPEQFSALLNHGVLSITE